MMQIIFGLLKKITEFKGKILRIIGNIKMSSYCRILTSKFIK
jgi:hypothetical protein